MTAKIPAGWNNRPLCQTPGDLLAWLDAQSDRHLAILRADQCRVTADGANTGQPVTSITVDPATLQQEQRIFASDILKAHDWLDANPIPGIPPRPVGLESRADGSLEATEMITAEHSRLRRAIAGAAAGGGGVVAEAVASASKPAVKGSVNERMQLTLLKNPEAANWSTQQWADCLGCTKSTVHATLQWKALHASHCLAKVERIQNQKQKRRLSAKDLDGAGIDKRKGGRNVDS